MEVLDLLRADGSIVVNKKLAHEIGLNEAVILSELISMYKYFSSEGQTENGWFYCTIDKMEENTSLSRELQDKAINSLIRQNLIEKDVRGLPARRHFRINESEIKKLILGSNNSKNSDDSQQLQIESETQTGMSQRHKQECVTDTNIHNTKDNNNKKFEEEDARAKEHAEKSQTSNQSQREAPDVIAKRFEQIFGRKLSVDFYSKLKDIYRDPKILLHALKLAEEKADKPAYLLTILKDWASNGLGTVEQINDYIEDRAQNKSDTGSDGRNGDDYDSELVEKLQDPSYLKKNGWH